MRPHLLLPQNLIDHKCLGCLHLKAAVSSMVGDLNTTISVGALLSLRKQEHRPCSSAALASTTMGTFAARASWHHLGRQTCPLAKASRGWSQLPFGWRSQQEWQGMKGGKEAGKFNSLEWPQVGRAD